MADVHFRPHHFHETLVAELTPRGRGAVAIVVVAGPDAVGAVGECFTTASGRSLQRTPIGRVAFGRWSSGEELVVCRRSEEEVEVHCHGGVAAAESVIASLVERRCRRIGWQEWVRKKSPDAIRGAAEIALAEAPTVRTAAVLLDQFCGALSAAVDAAEVAVSRSDWEEAVDTIEAILAFRELGLHLTTPWRVVLAGAPNVGKSSLMNALAGYQRAIVAHRPGTTRDVVTLVTAIDGWPVELADTAGLRRTKEAMEAAGVALTAAALAAADLTVVVRDAATAEAAESGPIDARSLASARTIHVWNKIDLISNSQRPSFHVGKAIPTSALTGEGIGALVAAIGRALVPVAPASGAAIAFTRQQLALLEQTHGALCRRNLSVASSAIGAFRAW